MNWWSEPNQYSINSAISAEIYSSHFGLHGPKGLAVVPVFAEGKTAPGWGSEFMENYQRGAFRMRRLGLNEPAMHHKKPFALVMRSVDAVCIDIDGKNGGFDGVKQLGMLPPTLAETSKSGDGYHLFYETNDAWDDEQGYAMFADRIGIADGVDIRATGCVYHYPNQKWNNRGMAILPRHLEDLLLTSKKKRDAEKAALTSIINNEDPVEVAMTHDDLIEDLGQPIPDGKRNNTLFAIGSKMKLAGVRNWDGMIQDRAAEIGLGSEETLKLIGNIEKYA